MSILQKLPGLATLVAAALTGSAAAVPKPYTVTPISIPGSYADFPVAVTSSGSVLGVYYDGSHQQHGYMYKSGIVTPFDVPGAATTNPLAINAGGDIVGYYTDQHGVTYGFIYRRGRYFTIGYQPYQTAALTGINDSRLTCGYASNGFNSAFTYKAGRFKQLDREASGVALAINNSGTVLASIGGQPAIYQDGKLIYIPVDGGTPTGINDLGIVVGNSTSGASSAFSYANGTVTTFAVRGARATFFNAINANGVVAGGFEDANFNEYGFVKNGSKVTQLPVIGNNYMTPLAINVNGVVAGAYLDFNTVNRSFVAVPPQ